jgi:hypothetical protein
LVDSEATNQPSGHADGDDSNGVDDEDGLLGPGSLIRCSTNTLTIVVGGSDELLSGGNWCRRVTAW